MRSWLGACLTLVLGVVLGYGAFDLLQIGPAGRNLWALAGPAAAVLFFTGLVYGRVLLGSAASCVGGIAVYGLIVTAVVAGFAGGLPGEAMGWSFVLGWVLPIMAVTVAPWGTGALLGRWSRRFQLTP